MNESRIIIYGSNYGSAKKYAEELSKRSNIKVENFENITNINSYDTIIYIGALYAGGVLGMSKTFKKLSSYENKKIIIATVGLADPTDEENTNNIKNNIKRQLSDEVFEKAYIYHLRGRVDYSKLSFTHKTMMSLLCKKAKNLPEEKKNAEVRAMIETFNKKVDFIDFNKLEDIIKEIEK